MILTEKQLRNAAMYLRNNGMWYELKQFIIWVQEHPYNIVKDSSYNSNSYNYNNNYNSYNSKMGTSQFQEDLNNEARSMAISSPSYTPYYSSGVTTSNTSTSYEEEERKAKEEKELEIRRLGLIAPYLVPYY